MEASTQQWSSELDVETAGVALEDQREATERASQRHDSLFRRALGVADILAVATTLLVSVVLGDTATVRPTAVVIPLIFVVIAKASRLYDRDANVLHHTTLDEIPSLFATATVAALILWLSDELVIEGWLTREQVLGFWLLLTTLLLTFRLIARALANKVSTVERCLFVGDEDDAGELREKLAQTPAVRAEVIDCIPVSSEPDLREAGRVELRRQIDATVQQQGIHRLILGPGTTRSGELPDWIRVIGSSGVKVSVMPDVARVVTSSTELDRLHGITLVGMRRSKMTLSSYAIKRGVDVVVSASALLAAAPFVAILALLIKLDSPGPVIFRQQRAGRHGEPFGVLKLRTMFDGAEERKSHLRHLNEAEGVFKIEADPRITGVGAPLRRLHLDELPQLWNVLRGDMSLVGPRPLPLDEDASLVGWHRRRLDMRPGMTGIWQALGSSRISVREMVKLDYQYVAHWSLWNDMRIMVLTLRQVLYGRGQ